MITHGQCLYMVVTQKTKIKQFRLKTIQFNELILYQFNQHLFTIIRIDQLILQDGLARGGALKITKFKNICDEKECSKILYNNNISKHEEVSVVRTMMKVFSQL